MNAMPKIAQVETRDAAEKFVARQTNGASKDQTEKFAKDARQMTDSSADAARDAVERTQATAAAVLADRGEVALRSSEAATKSGQMYLDLLAEQTRHGFETATALTRMIDWTEIFAAQRDFFTASLERSQRLNESYREMMQVGMKSAARPTGR
jgi:hypothetical protein